MKHRHSPPRLNHSLLAAALCSLVFGYSAQAAAAPPSRDACVQSHGKSQELRLDGKLLETRTELRICAESSCPEMVRSDCTAWLVETERQIPSFVVVIETDQGDLTTARAFVDGERLPSTNDDTAYERNPGIHRLRFELDGYPAIEDTVILRQDEKRSVVRARFQREAPQAAEASGAASAVKPGAPAITGPRPIPLTTYVFGGAALAAGGLAGYFGFKATSDYSDRKDSCAPNCPDSDVSTIKRNALIADVAGGAALISAGLATYFYVTRPARPDHSALGQARNFDILINSNRIHLGLHGAF
ncbi:MAG TPA: hypothetical protein VFQ61_02650 [Polyangiaceae bacterium]|nr:hypothetical protein [Polyangiaceae bacterium]